MSSQEASSPEALAGRIAQGDVRALARAATLVENRAPESVALLRRLFPLAGRALIVGITGAPGAGKSTLAGALIRQARLRQLRVAVVAVDPTSPFTGGAILGDRVRMQDHYADGGVFIRSMATRGRLGGLAAATADMTLLLDAAGFDLILVETVGVGQDEIDIARLAAVTVVVLVPGMGDGVQAIKAGLFEIAGLFAINKADHPGTDQFEQELRETLALGPRETPILRTVGTTGAGAAELLEAMRGQAARAPNPPWEHRLREMFRERVAERLPLEELRSAAAAVESRQSDPYSVVDRWLERYT
ncbi:MAG: methylmalonyl Co-A mutase-associated GTPase MeaB [Acidobacteria bacterium]|nr:methylmalonyl Co-A mutase-associated GTPase MeaB [Acidobacteriota bacterium]